MSKKQEKIKIKPQNKQKIIQAEQQIIYSSEIFVKKESFLFSRWKKNYMILIKINNSQLKILLHKNQKQKYYESINVLLSKISKKVSTVDNQKCFGIILPSDKKYLFSKNSLEQTIQIHQILISNRKKMKHFQGNVSSQNQSNSQQKQIVREIKQLQFQHCQHQYIKNENLSTNNPSPMKGYQQQNQMQKPNHTQIFCTVLEEEPINQQINQFQHLQPTTVKQTQFNLYKQSKQQKIQSLPLKLNKIISQQELNILLNDQGFKLYSNIDTGRLLIHKNQNIKYSIILKTFFSSREIIEFFMRFQLWNEKIKSASLINKIQEGIYLFKIQFKSSSWFSLGKFCFAVVYTCMIQGQYGLILRSLPEDQFDKQFGYKWIQFSLIIRIKEDLNSLQKHLIISSNVPQQEDLETMLNFFTQFKKIQLFLKTIEKPMSDRFKWKQKQDKILLQS